MPVQHLAAGRGGNNEPPPTSSTQRRSEHPDTDGRPAHRRTGFGYRRAMGRGNNEYWRHAVHGRNLCHEPARPTDTMIFETKSKNQKIGRAVVGLVAELEDEMAQPGHGETTIDRTGHSERFDC